MKSEKGITLAALVIYIIFISALLVLLGNLTSYMYGNFQKIGSNSVSSEEFNKFNQKFVKDVKESKKVEVQFDSSTNNYTIVFENGANYTYIFSEKAIYRNEEKISKNILVFEAEAKNNASTNNKNVIKVKIGTGKNSSEPNFGKTISYVLKYW